MKSIVEEGNAATQNTGHSGQWRRKLLSPFVCSVLAGFGIFGGISALIVGLMCVIVHAVLSADRVFDTVGTALLIAAIPMILVGSVFLDEIDRK